MVTSRYSGRNPRCLAGDGSGKGEMGDSPNHLVGVSLVVGLLGLVWVWVFRLWPELGFAGVE